MKFQRSYLAIIIGLTMTLSACSETPMDSDNPLVDSTEIDNVIEEFLSQDAVIGLSVATIKKSDDKTLIWSKEYGLRNIESSAPVNADTSLQVASVSKAVMGMAMVIAKQNGFLQLDDNVHGLLESSGAFSLDNPEKQAVTIDNLVKHTSGVIDNVSTYHCTNYLPTADGGYEILINGYIDSVPCPAQTPITLPGFLSAYLDSDGILYNATENFSRSAPGSTSHYSNIGSALAGYLVEVTTGQDLASYAQQEIFTPLGMNNTSWRSEWLNSDDIATPYLYDAQDDVVTALPKFELATWPDGGLLTNAADLAKILSIILNDGVQISTGNTLLTADSLNSLLPADTDEFGVFWAQQDLITDDGKTRRLIGHNGGYVGVFSAMYYDPISETGIVLIGNSTPGKLEGDSPAEVVNTWFADNIAFNNSTTSLISALFDSADKLE